MTLGRTNSVLKEIQVRQIAGVEKRRWLGRSLSAVAGAVLYAAAGVSATVAASDWSEERIAGLFPAPLEGWASGAVEIEERDTITSGFESFALAPLTETAAVGVRVRLKATRAYSLSEKGSLFSSIRKTSSRRLASMACQQHIFPIRSRARNSKTPA